MSEHAVLEQEIAAYVAACPEEGCERKGGKGGCWGECDTAIRDMRRIFRAGAEAMREEAAGVTRELGRAKAEDAKGMDALGERVYSYAASVLSYTSATIRALPLPGDDS